MTKPNVLILRAPGTNCDQETGFAFEQAGGQATILHVNRILENSQLLDDFQILCIPGGFSFGDDVAAGRILAGAMQRHLADAMRKFRDDGKLILGICNGFQVLIKSGLLLTDDEQGPPATLTWNDSGRFDDRWVRLTVKGDGGPFLSGVTEMYLPIAHAEGKFVARNEATLDALREAGHLVLRYAPLDAVARAGYDPDKDTLPWPDNPNGSMVAVAGIRDTTGRVFGLMPHPERHIDPTHHPRWTRGEAGTEGDGLAMFQGAINYFA